MKSAGFTGTDKGMSNAQLLQVHMWLGDLKTGGFGVARHGICIGSDEQFHHMATAMKYHTVGYPGVTKKGLVFKRSPVTCDEVRKEKFFLDRNRDIVADACVMIATPAQVEEQLIGSGTWATIRYARKAKKLLMIVFPDGTTKFEGGATDCTVDYFKYLTGAGDPRD